MSLSKIIFGSLLSFLMVPSALTQEIDIQGHRGARGLVPENSIPAFMRALNEGVSTLELDVVITKDKQVLISHDPYMLTDICSKPNGEPVTKEEVEGFNIYQMTYEEVQQFDCGSRGNARFPEQQKMLVTKPLLANMIDEVEEHLTKNNLAKVNYNIEIKSLASDYGISQPPVDEFSQLVLEVITQRLDHERFTIQSFDFNVLKHIHQTYPKVALVALVENKKGVEANLSDLGFVPEIYSPYYLLLNKKAVELCHQKGMKVVPWTVNDRDRMEKLIEMGVDGIITDYPNRAKGLSK